MAMDDYGNALTEWHTVEIQHSTNPRRQPVDSYVLTPEQRNTIDFYKAYTVPASWFVGTHDASGRVEILALGADFIWSVLRSTLTATLTCPKLPWARSIPESRPDMSALTMHTAFDGWGDVPDEYQDRHYQNQIVTWYYSYATPIAWKHADGTWYMPPVRYSNTTTTHQRRVADAIDYDYTVELSLMVGHGGRSRYCDRMGW